MMLQPITPKLPPNSHKKNDSYLYAVSFSSGLLRNSTFFLNQPIISTRWKSYKNPSFVTCSSRSRVHSYGTVDKRKKAFFAWRAIYKKISTLDDPSKGAASVLNEVENQGKNFTKWELGRIVKELRKFRRYEFALQVYEWMNNRAERYRITTSDTAVSLDLIAKVHGVSSAEQYFLKLPDGLKDKRIYGSLLNAYVHARMREKAESHMEEMRNRGYASYTLPFNVMTTLYKNLKDHEKVESLIAEMKEKNIPLDFYTYNIWLSSCGSQGSLEKMEKVYEQMQLDDSINPNWTTFSTMATIYIKLGHIEKGEDCLRKIESRITNRDQMPYHHLISLYGSTGNKDEVYRIWNAYKALFFNVPNVGYHAIISALVRLDDIEAAEKLYDEWLSMKSFCDPRVSNLLLGSYVRKGLSQKAETFFNQLVELGGKPNSMTWEILAEFHIQNMRISEAVSCLQSATLATGSKSWKPRPINITKILKIFEQEGDTTVKDKLIDVLRQTGCLDDVTYMSCLPMLGDGAPISSVPAVEDQADSDVDEDESNLLLNQLQESL